jgi:hypothetical protein
LGSLLDAGKGAPVGRNEDTKEQSAVSGVSLLNNQKRMNTADYVLEEARKAPEKNGMVPSHIRAIALMRYKGYTFVEIAREMNERGWQTTSDQCSRTYRKYQEWTFVQP